MSDTRGVSIIVVNYNNERFLAVRSMGALSQEYPQTIAEADTPLQVAAPAVFGEPRLPRQDAHVLFPTASLSQFGAHVNQPPVLGYYFFNKIAVW